MCGVSYALSGHFHYHTVSQSVLNLNHRCWTDHGGCRRSDSVIDMMSAAADHWYSTVRAALSGEDMAPYAEKPYNYGKY